MSKKRLTVGIILIFVLSSLIPLASSDVNDVDNTIIVDDEGDGDYTVIQDAIDNASEGDTIFVYSGTYPEADITTYDKTNPIIGVTLKGIPYELGEGNDVGKPRIVGNGIGSLLRLLWADRCTVKGFELANSDCGISLYDSANNTIVNNTVLSCYTGVEIKDFSSGLYSECSCNNIVENNTIVDCIKGIQIDYASNNIIRRNMIKDCHWGISTEGIRDTIIYSNRFLSNGDYDLWGEPYGGSILIDFSFNNIIEKNHFEDNIYGVPISASFLTVVRKNNFIDNEEHHATFLLSLTTTWNNNFWGKERILPQPIFGMIGMRRSGIPISWVQFDWHPAREPYDISIP